MANNGCADMDRLLATIRTQVPGVTDDMINLTLFNVIDRHLRKTNAWRYVSTIPLTRGVIDYPIFPPAGTAMVRVIEATHAGRPVAPAIGGVATSGQRGRFVADETWPDQDAGFFADEEVSEGAVTQYAVYYPTYVSINLPPSDDAVEQPLSIIMALTVGKDSLECDCGEWSIEPWMWDRYHDDWLNGVLGSMFAMHAKPWSNQKMALFHEKRFFSSISFARQEAHRGFVFDRPMWRYPRGGGWVTRRTYA